MDFRIASPDDCALINSIATQIWAPTYSHLMGRDQLDYMFDMMYSPTNLGKAMAGGQTFLIFYASGNGCDSNDRRPVSYVSYETLADHDFYLQKIYLLPGMQGHGMGKEMLCLLTNHLLGLDPEARRLSLNVNRKNLKAVYFYLRNGFEFVSRRDHHIGNGYYMNDYILERNIRSNELSL